MLNVRGFHGTPFLFTQFDSRKSAHGMIFFSLEDAFAIDWACENRDDPAYLITADISVSSPWDYLNPEHVARLLAEMKLAGITPLDQCAFSEGLEDGDWMTIEQTPGLIDVMKRLGFDAMFVTEGSECDRNIACFGDGGVEILKIEAVDKFGMRKVVEADQKPQSGSRPRFR